MTLYFCALGWELGHPVLSFHKCVKECPIWVVPWLFFPPSIVTLQYLWSKPCIYQLTSFNIVFQQFFELFLLSERILVLLVLKIKKKSFMKGNVYSISKVCLGLRSAGLFRISSLFPCLCPGGVCGSKITAVDQGRCCFNVGSVLTCSSSEEKWEIFKWNSWNFLGFPLKCTFSSISM